MLLLAATDPGGEFLGGIFVGSLVTLMLVGFVAARRRKNRARKPKLAGSAIPELGEGLDLAHRYDITCAGEWGETFLEHFENARIVGYVGGDQDDAIAKMYMRGRWLVVEFADGRRGYLLPRSIRSLRQSGTQA